MFFEKEMISFHILDVLEIDQKNISRENRGRNYNAISFRFSADTILSTQKTEYHVTDGAVAFFPARLDYRRVARVDKMIVVHFDCMDYHSDDIEVCYLSKPEKTKRLFRDILEQWNLKTEGYKYRCASILYEIFAECYAQNHSKEKGNSKIRNSVEYLQKHFCDAELTMARVAKQSFISEVYFRKLFKQEFGTSPQKYIVHLRIQNAKGLIATGYYLLQQVAEMSGYNDYKYFTTEFKKEVGISPSAYSYNYR